MKEEVNEIFGSQSTGANPAGYEKPIAIGIYAGFLLFLTIYHCIQLATKSRLTGGKRRSHLFSFPSANKVCSFTTSHIITSNFTPFLIISTKICQYFFDVRKFLPSILLNISRISV